MSNERELELIAERDAENVNIRRIVKEFLEANIHISESRIVNENPDSLEMGTPSKLGCIKVYGDFNRLEDFKKKIDAAFAAREYANSKTV